MTASQNVQMMPSKLHLSEVPEGLRRHRAWLLWRFEQFPDEAKPRKVPYYASGRKRAGRQGAVDDVRAMVSFDEAREALASSDGYYDGLGFAPRAEHGLLILDFDNCIDAKGDVPPDVAQIAASTYSEVTPSGKGLRCIYEGHFPNRKSKTEGNAYGFETFSESGFVTITGDVFDLCEIMGSDTTIAKVTPEVEALCAARFGPREAQAPDPDDFMLGRKPPLGLEVEEMEALLDLLDPDMGRDEWVRVGMALHHETQGDDTGFDLWNDWSSLGGKYPSEEALRGQWESFERRKGDRRPQVTMATVKQMVKNSNVTPADEWPVPSPLPDALLPVPPLTEDMLPKDLALWLTDIADRMSVPLDFVGVPAMVMLGSLIGNKVVVRPDEFTDWSEPANLWGAIMAPPGAMKTPAVNQVLAPIRKLEEEAQIENKLKLEKHSLAVLVQKSKRDAVMQGARKNSTSQSPDNLEQALMACAIEPPKPKLKRFITTDATVEKLGEICADNTNGVLYHRDELPTLFLDLQREEKAAVRGFLLTGWTGMEAYTFDRIGRGTTHIEAVNLSLFGTAQPQRIANLVSVSTAKHDDGMIQRLQLLAWPDFVSEWVPVDRLPDQAAREAAFACCKRLSSLIAGAVDAQVDAGGGKPFLRLNDEARETFMSYRVILEANVRSRSLPEPLAAHLSKYRGMVPRLALILHLAGNGCGPITGDAMRAAIKWAVYLEQHARRMYASSDMATSDTAGLILRRIRNGELCDGFSQRDITQKGWSGLQDANAVERALRTLQKHDWLRSTKVPTSGRPKEIFHINPSALPKAATE